MIAEKQECIDMTPEIPKTISTKSEEEWIETAHLWLRQQMADADGHIADKEQYHRDLGFLVDFITEVFK